MLLSMDNCNSISRGRTPTLSLKLQPPSEEQSRPNELVTHAEKNFAKQTTSECPNSVCTHSPDTLSQILGTVLDLFFVVVTIKAPSAEYIAE